MHTKYTNTVSLEWMHITRSLCTNTHRASTLWLTHTHYEICLSHTDTQQGEPVYWMMTTSHKPPNLTDQCFLVMCVYCSLTHTGWHLCVHQPEWGVFIHTQEMSEYRVSTSHATAACSADSERPCWFLPLFLMDCFLLHRHPGETQRVVD